MLSRNGSELRGSYDPQADTIMLPLLDSMPAMLFSRRTDHDAMGFYPRVFPETEGYKYDEPVLGNDGWPTASLAAVGLREPPWRSSSIKS